MGKLHEILAVEGARRGAYEKVLKETTQVFANRADLFQAAERRYEPFAEEDASEAGVVERHEMTTTVAQRMDYLRAYMVDYLDTVYQKEMTNQLAAGDIMWKGTVLVAAVPVPYLLHLESAFGRLREVLNHIPTHQSGIKWIRDETHALRGVVKSEHPEETFKTKKIIKPFELSPATKEHKAQVEKLAEDKPVGKFYRELWSGMFTPARKAAVLGNLDTLIEAVRVARMQANDRETVNEKAALKLLEQLW